MNLSKEEMKAIIDKYNRKQKRIQSKAVSSLNRLKLFDRLNAYAGKYQISMQLWGRYNNQIYIQKDDVDLWSCGNEKTPDIAMKSAVEYLDRINAAYEHIK